MLILSKYTALCTILFKNTAIAERCTVSISLNIQTVSLKCFLNIVQTGICSENRK